VNHREDELMDFGDYPKELDLRDGTRVWLRQSVANDRVRLFEFFKSLSDKERRYFKHDVSKRETIDSWCDNLDYDLTLPILAVTRRGKGEKVVGNSTLHTERHGWATHVARIRVQVLPDMRKRGLGQVLLRELCDRAAMRGIDKIQAHVRADNAAGLKVMRRLGFRKEGVFKDHVIARNGRRHDMVILYEDLEDLWRRMEDLNLDLDTPSLWP
jgi:RimJ/RimL family protein N-acetyltransferase